MMVIQLNHRELKEMIMEKVKEELSQSEVFAGLIWHFCINSQDHFYKGEYYDLPVSFQYDNDGVSLLNVNYLQQSNQWSLISPDYKHILRIAPLVLKWMDDTYFAYVASRQQMSTPQKTEERDENTPYKTRPQEESDSPVIFHTRYAVIPAAILPTPSLQDPGKAEGTGPKTDSKQSGPC